MRNPVDFFNALIEDIKNRVRLTVGRCIITAMNTGGQINVAQIQLLADEVLDDVPVVQQYGFVSAALPGAEGVNLSLGGMRDNSVIIATNDRRYSIKNLAGGEVAIYTDEGDKIHLKRGKVIRIETSTLEVAATTKISFTTPALEVSGYIYANGEIRSDTHIRDSFATPPGKTMAQMRTIYNTHTHPENNVGSTNQPNQQM